MEERERIACPRVTDLRFRYASSDDLRSHRHRVPVRLTSMRIRCMVTRHADEIVRTPGRGGARLRICRRGAAVDPQAGRNPGRGLPAADATGGRGTESPDAASILRHVHGSPRHSVSTPEIDRWLG